MIAEDLDTLEPQQLREALRASRAEVAFKQAVIDKLTHENPILKRLKFAAKSEIFHAEQKSLLEETLDSDLAAVAAEIEAMQPASKAVDGKQRPKREKLPPSLPRREIRHEPEDTTCGCGTPMQRIGEDVAEKLDYQPGVFTVERHIRGKWVCRCCSQRGEGRITQAPVAPHVIDKGLPTTGLLAQVLVGLLARLHTFRLPTLKGSAPPPTIPGQTLALLAPSSAGASRNGGKRATPRS